MYVTVWFLFYWQTN